MCQQWDASQLPFPGAFVFVPTGAGLAVLLQTPVADEKIEAHRAS